MSQKKNEHGILEVDSIMFYVRGGQIFCFCFYKGQIVNILHFMDLTISLS